MARSPGCLVGAGMFCLLGLVALLLLLLEWVGALPPVVGASLGVIALIVGCSTPVVVLLHQAEQEAAHYLRVLREGPRTEATVARLEQQGRTWQLEALGNHPLLGQPCRFRGPVGRGPLPASLAVGQPIVVVVDPSDPARALIAHAGSEEHRPAGWARCLPVTASRPSA
ncbi:MAG: hypothetical protein KatS3mg061_0418 [Dehalococcoidia bacterium]|nr:MAG: hypothetical protein KatS3mg061_0418 [Dehalococcoidia bacterium]